MAHAEKCPICYGKDKTLAHDPTGIALPRKNRKCHGRFGTGCVQVADAPPIGNWSWLMEMTGTQC